MAAAVLGHNHSVAERSDYGFCPDPVGSGSEPAGVYAQRGTAERVPETDVSGESDEGGAGGGEREDGDEDACEEGEY